MTNNDHLNNITGEIDTPEISAVKMILTRIDEDLENDLYEENRDKYLNLYKSQKEWLEREVENEQTSTLSGSVQVPDRRDGKTWMLG